MRDLRTNFLEAGLGAFELSSNAAAIDFEHLVVAKFLEKFGSLVGPDCAQFSLTRFFDGFTCGIKFKIINIPYRLYKL